VVHNRPALVLHDRDARLTERRERLLNLLVARVAGRVAVRHHPDSDTTLLRPGHRLGHVLEVEVVDGHVKGSRG
jgi:hypothetical protein